MNWKKETLQELVNGLKNDPAWNSIRACITKDDSPVGVHLAIFSEDLMDKLIEGEKKLESRFSSNLISPHGQIKKGDVVIVKKTGGPASAVFIAGDVITYQNLTTLKIAELKRKFTEALGLSGRDDFWKTKAESKYATFIQVEKLRILRPFTINKRDRTGWVVLKHGSERSLFKKDENS